MARDVPGNSELGDSNAALDNLRGEHAAALRHADSRCRLLNGASDLDEGLAGREQPRLDAAAAVVAVEGAVGQR